MKSSFIRGPNGGPSTLSIKIRCTSNHIRIQYTEPFECIDAVADPDRYSRALQVIESTCLPDDIYQQALLETITHVETGRVRLFIADPPELTLVDDFGLTQMAPRMRATLENDLRLFVHNPNVYVHVSRHGLLGGPYTMLERGMSVLASYAAGRGHYYGQDRFNGLEILGFSETSGTGVFLYEDRNLILVGPAERSRSSNRHVYPLCFKALETTVPPIMVPKFNVSLPAECPICMDNMTTKNGCDTLPCGHMFHETCMQQWRGQLRNRVVTCPICREAADNS